MIEPDASLSSLANAYMNMYSIEWWVEATGKHEGEAKAEGQGEGEGEEANMHA